MRQWQYVLLNRLLPLAISVLATGIAITFLRGILLDRFGPPNRSKDEIQQELFKYLEHGINTGETDDIFCKTAFNHFDRKSGGQLSSYGYVETLEDFIVYISNKGDTLDSARYKNSLGLLTHAKETEPFASLPSEERRLMDNIQVFIERGEAVNAANQLNELKQVILARHKEYQRIEKQNSWSIPLAITGLLVTLVFGVYGIVRSLRRTPRRG